MGILVRLIGSGVGLAAATAGRRKSSTSASASASNSNTDLSHQASASSATSATPSSSSHHQHRSDQGSDFRDQRYDGSSRDSLGVPSEAPPAYDDVVMVSEQRASELVSSGKARHYGDEKGRGGLAGAEKGRGAFQEEEGSEEDDDDEDDESDDDETHWALDEAAEDVKAVSTGRETDQSQHKAGYTVGAQKSIESYVSAIMSRCPPPVANPYGPLPDPVIIPQRRPGARQRGFIHAYAPVLESRGISQDTFLGFLDAFEHASQASPILNVVYISAAVTGLVPEPICQITGTVVQIAAGAAIELQMRARTHSFLDEVNAQLFKPRGLYAMIMSYNPQGVRPIYAQQEDLGQLIARRTEQEGSRMNISGLNAGKSLGNVEMPRSAELVFPALDQAAETVPKGERENVFKRGAGFVADYNDKRAQASYLHQNPNQALSMPSPQFSNSLSDPTHPAFQGGLFTLLSGGKIPPKHQRRMAHRQQKMERRAMKGKPMRRKNARRMGGNAAGGNMYRFSKHDRKKIMKMNVLYLMVVEMPGERELEEARRLSRQ